MATQKFGEVSSLSLLFNESASYDQNDSSSGKGFVSQNLNQTKVSNQSRKAPLNQPSFGGSKHDIVEFFKPKTKVISPIQILESEDYTCVTRHFLESKITMYYEGYRLECHPATMSMFFSHGENKEELSTFDHVSMHRYATPLYPSGWLLNFCGACEMGLDGGQDLHIYRGRQSFCDYCCLVVGVLAEEITKVSNNVGFFHNVLLEYELKGKDVKNGEKECGDEEEEDIFHIEDLEI